ncbi:MAG: VWA domain-containing protein, partial [Thermoplasmatales archaeon]|nr:VWA domain-containing protein [Thermoplasmatales archaeon]
EVSVGSQLLRFIATIVLKYSLSNRSMITTVKVARAIAALSSRKEVNIEDIRTALKFSLRHRLKNQKKQQENLEQEIEDKINELDRQDDDPASGEESESPDRETGSRNPPERKESEDMKVNIDARNEVKLSGKTGTSHSYRRIGQKDGVTFDFYSSMISMAKNGRKKLSFRDIQFRDTVSRGSVPIIIALDTSRSMGVFQRMQAAKNISRSLITSAYISRSRVALITFSGTAGEIATNYTRNLSSIENLIDAVEIRGKTPLSHALMLVNSLSSEEFRKNGRGIAMFLTDGKGNVPVSGDMKEEIEELSTELGKTSDVYIVHSSRGSQRFLPTFNDTIARCSGGRIINIAELEHQIRIGV